MEGLLLSGYQALQLLALGPCLFMVFFLCVAGRKAGQILVPALYFLSLACSFLLPLRDTLGLSDRTYAALLLGASAEAALGFLLIVQSMTNRTPPAVYWSVLALPLMGGGQLVYATVMTDSEICLYENICTRPYRFQELYDIFSISLICMLSLLIYRRLDESKAAGFTQTRQKYALVLALVILNLALLAIDLAHLMNLTDDARAKLSGTVVHIGFIYLTLTLIFRMFDHPVELAYERVPHMRPQDLSAKDQALAEEIRLLLTREKLHRDTELDREKLARKLAVTEATLSRVINRCFQETTSMLVNRHRVEEARELLCSEGKSITAIAFDVGFSSIASFNRVFRQMTDMSPSEYRNANKTAREQP